MFYDHLHYLVEAMFYLIYFFPTPPIELKLGLQIGGRLLPLATYLHQIIMIAQSETESSSYHIYYTLL
jgi:hypothetical protein